MVVPLSRTIAQLAWLARMRGHEADGALLVRVEALVRARQIESDEDLGRLLDDHPADTDPEVLRPLKQMYHAGAWVLVQSAIADLPADLRLLSESGTVTLDQLILLHDTCGVTTIADVLAAVEEQAVRSVPGLDVAVERALAGALGDLRSAKARIPLGRATELVDPILTHLRSLRGVDWAQPCGSLRRGQETVGDIELVAAAADPSAAIDDVAHLPNVERLLHRSARRLYLRIDRVQIGLRVPEPADAASTLLHLTGSAAHFSGLRARASARGWRLTAEGLHTPDGTRRMAASEDAIYRALDLPFIPAEIRDGNQEISVAARGELPSLLSQVDIRGDLHMHSVWSDGRDSIEAMVTACRDLGYEYLAITDHSPHSGLSRHLTIEGARRQGDEIAALRERVPDIAILHGCEVDILPGGQLDFPDSLLERFDIVLASLHDRSGQSPDRLLGRYLSAVRHPLVTLITHPTNRLVPHRAGYDLEYDRLFEAVAETGTVVEIDGAPVHLDMDGQLAKRAVATGATIAVNSDGHRARLLERQMRLGVATARRGWVETRHVLNTRPLAEVRALIARKRAR